MSAARRATLLLAVAAALAGCVSDDGRATNPEEAARANVKLGVAYLQQGNLPLAKEKLERALDQDSRNPEVHSALAFLYERLDRKPDAEKHYASARRLAPGSGEVANTYAVFLCRNGKATEALREFESAAKNPLYPTPWAALTNAAVCARTVKRDAEATGFLEQAIRIRPNYAEAYAELADLQLAGGDAKAAGETVNRFLSIGLASPDVMLVGVRAAQARGDAATLALLTRRLRRDFPNAVQTRALPQVLGEKGTTP